MNRLTLIVISFVFGILCSLIGHVVYSIIQAAHEPHKNAYVRDGSGVCLKQLRVIQLISTDNARPDGIGLGDTGLQRLCDSPHNTQIRARNIQMKGDTYDVKCLVPGYPASEKPIEVFYWGSRERVWRDRANTRNRCARQLYSNAAL
jgi:hypothetical protein